MLFSLAAEKCTVWDTTSEGKKLFSGSKEQLTIYIQRF